MITLNQLLENPSLAETNLSEAIDAVYDEIDDTLISRNYLVAENSIKKILSIESYTKLPLYLSARIISRVHRDKYPETFKLLCKKIYDVALITGGQKKIINVAGLGSWKEEILEHEERI